MLDSHPRACRRLWAEVLRTGLADAWRDPSDTWIGTREFFATCDMAGLDPDAARDVASALRKHHARLRAAGADQPKAGLPPLGILRAGAAA